MLNAVGWLALVGSGLFLGALLWLIALPPVVAIVVGEIAAFAALTGVDHLRARNSMVLRCTDAPKDRVQFAISEMQGNGLRVSYQEVVDEIEGDIRSGAAIVFRHADRRGVEDELRRRGL